MGTAKNVKLGSVLISFLSTALIILSALPTLAAPVRAVAAHVAEEGDTVVLTFDLDGKVGATAHGLAGPDRIVIDLPTVGFFMDPSIGRDLLGKAGGSLIKSFRFGAFDADSSRVVVDLAKPACVTSIEDEPLSTNGTATRLRLTLARCDDAKFLASIPAAAPPVSAAAPAAPSEQPGPPLPVIVIDPGHGGIDGGAYGVGGAVEKNITLAFAQSLAERLEKSGKYRVAMTRKDDTFVALEDRVKFAEDSGAALFISIHADTLAEAANVSGTTVYSGAERASDGESARIAARENAADKAAGAEQRDSSADVSDILFDLKRRESRAYTHLFSHGLIDAWRQAGKLNHNPERAANFFVLKSPDYPSVLVELGFLSNPEDVKQMKSPEWRQKTGEALENAINGFFAGSGAADATPTAVRQP